MSSWFLCLPFFNNWFKVIQSLSNSFTWHFMNLMSFYGHLYDFNSSNHFNLPMIGRQLLYFVFVFCCRYTRQSNNKKKTNNSHMEVRRQQYSCDKLIGFVLAKRKIIDVRSLSLKCSFLLRGVYTLFQRLIHSFTLSSSCWSSQLHKWCCWSESQWPCCESAIKHRGTYIWTIHRTTHKTFAA